MNNTITHSGVIEKIGSHHVTVRIEQVSACASCKVAGHCNASDRQEKLIDVDSDRPGKYRVGEAVVIAADTRTGFRAVVLGFGLPLAILMMLIFVIKASTGSDGQAAVAGMAGLIPYYILLYLMRKKLHRKFSFKIQP